MKKSKFLREMKRRQHPAQVKSTTVKITLRGRSKLWAKFQRRSG